MLAVSGRSHTSRTFTLAAVNDPGFLYTNVDCIHDGSTHLCMATTHEVDLALTFCPANV